MKAIVDPRQAKHNPQHFMATGKVLPNPEQPRRIEVLQSGAIAAGRVLLLQKITEWAQLQQSILPSI